MVRRVSTVSESLRKDEGCTESHCRYGKPKRHHSHLQGDELSPLVLRPQDVQEAQNRDRHRKATAASSIPAVMPEAGLNFPCRPKPIETEFTWRIGRMTTATTSTRPCDTTLGEKKCGRRRTVAERRCSPDSSVMKPDG